VDGRRAAHAPPCRDGELRPGRLLDHYQQTKNMLVSYDPKPMGFF
jgi:hypothetical protein